MALQDARHKQAQHYLSYAVSHYDLECRQKELQRKGYL